MTKRHALLGTTLIVLGIFIIAAANMPKRARADSPTELPCCNFVLRAGVPFAWLRSSPSSYSMALTTIYPGNVFVAENTTNKVLQTWDGTQWWGYFHIPNTNFYGWIEIQSVQGGITAPTPTQVPRYTVTPTPGPVKTGCCTFVLTPGLPFAWLRESPASTASVVTTIYPGQRFEAAGNTLTQSSDNIQWWGNFRVPGTSLYGWIEMKGVRSVDNSTQPTATAVPITIPKAPWAVSNLVKVRSTVSFVWLRALPLSYAPILETVYGGATYIIVGDPTTDGMQWWWHVQNPLTRRIGWVEQDSLVLASKYAPLTPTPATTDAFIAEQLEAYPKDTITLRWNIPGASNIALHFVHLPTGSHGDLWERVYPETLAAGQPAQGTFTYTLPLFPEMRFQFQLDAVDSAGKSISLRTKTVQPKYYPCAPETEARLSMRCVTPATNINVIVQKFEKGYMLWRSDTNVIVVILGPWKAYPNQWQSGEVVTITETPPDGKIAPKDRFAKLWSTDVEVRKQLGWAEAAEVSYDTTIQTTDRMDSGGYGIRLKWIEAGKYIQLVAYSETDGPTYYILPF